MNCLSTALLNMCLSQCAAMQFVVVQISMLRSFSVRVDKAVSEYVFTRLFLRSQRDGAPRRPLGARLGARQRGSGYAM